MALNKIKSLLHKNNADVQVEAPNENTIATSSFSVDSVENRNEIDNESQNRYRTEADIRHQIIPSAPQQFDLQNKIKQRLHSAVATDTNASLEEQYKAIINKQEEKRKNWNAYMRGYYAKRKKEQKEKENKISIEFKGVEQMYNKEDIKRILFSYINVFVAILNVNKENIPKEMLNEIDEDLHSNDVITYATAVLKAVKILLNI